MMTENNNMVEKTQTTQKKEWEQPQLIELDINKTESGLSLGDEYLVLSA